VSENRVLRGIFRPKKNEIIGGCRTLYKEELHNLFSSPNIIRIIKSRGVRWAEHVAHMAENKNACRLFGGKVSRKETTKKT
jgi:hypothetical protein